MWGIDWPTEIVVTLTLATALFAIVPILLAIGGVFAYIDVKTKAQETARKTAEEVATKIATDIANSVASKAAQEKIAAILTNSGNLGSDVPPPDANRIAGAQE